MRKTARLSSMLITVRGSLFIGDGVAAASVNVTVLFTSMTFSGDSLTVSLLLLSHPLGGSRTSLLSSRRREVSGVGAFRVARVLDTRVKYFHELLNVSRKALNEFKSNKAPGFDELRAELIKNVDVTLISSIH